MHIHNILKKAVDWWQMSDHKNKMNQRHKEVEAIYEKTNNIRKRISALKSSHGWDKKPAEAVPVSESKAKVKSRPGLEDIKAKLRKK